MGKTLPTDRFFRKARPIKRICQARLSHQNHTLNVKINLGCGFVAVVVVDLICFFMCTRINFLMNTIMRDWNFM